MSKYPQKNLFVNNGMIKLPLLVCLGMFAISTSGCYRLHGVLGSALVPKQVFKTIVGEYIFPAAHKGSFAARQPLFLREVDRVARAQGFARYGISGSRSEAKQLALYQETEWRVYLGVVLPSGAIVPEIVVSGKNTVAINRAVKALLKTLRESFPDLQFKVTTDEYFDYV